MTAEERKRTLRGILHDVLYCLLRHLPFKMAAERSRTIRSVLHVSFTYKTFLVVNHPEIALTLEKCLIQGKIIVCFTSTESFFMNYRIFLDIFKLSHVASTKV